MVLIKVYFNSLNFSHQLIFLISCLEEEEEEKGYFVDNSRCTSSLALQQFCHSIWKLGEIISYSIFG